MFNTDREDGRYPYPAPAVYVPGQIVVRPDGSRAEFDGLFACEVGKTISPNPLKPERTATISVVPANTFAPAASVYWDQAAQTGTSTAAGNTVIGRAIFAKAAGEPTMLIVVSG